MIIDYNKTISKFKRGGAGKLEASHELILSIHSYINYLTKRFHPYLFINYLDDVIPDCHLYLLKKIYLFDPDRARFTTWSRFHILNNLATCYGRYTKVVTTSRGFPVNKTLYLGVPDALNMNTETIDSDPLLYNRLKNIILDKYNQRDWDLFYDYFYNNYTLRELTAKYKYNNWQAVHKHILKILKFLKTNNQLIEDLR